MSKYNYSFCDQLLHHFALGLPWVGQISLDIERFVMNKEGVRFDSPPIFISGLARAGTTILMRTFYSTGLFRSLIYRDLPFVLMPGLWKKISRFSSRSMVPEERAHGDKIMVDFDSPEALEEIFWRTFCATDYIFEDHLEPHLVDEETVKQFSGFVKQVMISNDQPNQQRYLSKNNNNILRFEAIRKAFPEAIIIIPFRNPLQQSISLFQTHSKFCKMHGNDPFTRHYMSWLGHHEFGSTHKPFWFGNDIPIVETKYGPDSVNYWLAIWGNTYRYILKLAPSGSIFVNFEELCRIPKTILKSLFSRAGLSIEACTIDEKIQAPKVKTVENIDTVLESQVMCIHQDLLARVAQSF